jgi:hypothetical protein
MHERRQELLVLTVKLAPSVDRRRLVAADADSGEVMWFDLARGEHRTLCERRPELLLDTEPPMYGSASAVATVLATSDDPRVERAMLDGAVNPSARRPLNAVLWGMSERPRAACLEAVRAILANEALASDVAHPTRDGPFAGAVGIRVTRSAYAHALRVAMLLPGSEGRDLVRRLAIDRSASAPDPGVLAALVCPPGELQVDIEARGLASLRIMALDALDDRALMARIRDDPTEPDRVHHARYQSVFHRAPQARPSRASSRPDRRAPQTLGGAAARASSSALTAAGS